jgi:hypothetical protein
MQRKSREPNTSSEPPAVVDEPGHPLAGAGEDVSEQEAKQNRERDLPA